MIERLVHELRARKSGAGWIARCPAHDDHNPSLSIREVDGKTLFHCFAGCEQLDVLAKFKAQGLWEESSNSVEQRRIIATYDYGDEAGELLYQVVRYDPKDFRQRHPDGHGGWVWKKGPRQILYRVLELLEAPIVFVVEGEKDVETLRGYGFVATTNAGGAKAPWLSEYTETLAGREVIIIPDNDSLGWERAKGIARALLGRAARIVILDDIHRHGAKDITQWFERGHSECELIAMLDGVHAV